MNHFDDKHSPNFGDPQDSGRENPLDDLNSSKAPSKNEKERNSSLGRVPPLDVAQFISELRAPERNIDYLNEAMSVISAPFIQGDIGTLDILGESAQLLFLKNTLGQLSLSILDENAFSQGLRILNDTLDHEACHRAEHHELLTWFADWLVNRVTESRFSIEQVVKNDYAYDMQSVILMYGCIESLLGSRVTRDVLVEGTLIERVSSELSLIAAILESELLPEKTYHLLVEGESDYISAVANVARCLSSPELQEPLRSVSLSLEHCLDDEESDEELDDSTEESEEDIGWDELEEDLDLESNNDAVFIRLHCVDRALVTCQHPGELVSFWEELLSSYEMHEAEWADALAGLFFADEAQAGPYITKLIQSIVSSLQSEANEESNEIRGDDSSSVVLTSRILFSAVTELLAANENAGDSISAAVSEFSAGDQRALSTLAAKAIDDGELSAILAEQSAERSIPIDAQILEIFSYSQQ
jgi:hypothetical protein